ncbi:fibronectin type III domain-containing protein [Candidatus Poriferisodalis sp.]|uniref:fibronectin type III domain-containing protein n=1 Tax=Candidatus Poriferisodalis sp. TaxID=3101277 RepID=UPI003C6FB62C
MPCESAKGYAGGNARTDHAHAPPPLPRCLPTRRNHNSRCCAGAAAAADQPAGIPARPTGLRVTSEAHDAITIAWDDPGDTSITGYQILRRLRDVYEVGRFDIIAPDTATAGTVFTDTDVTASTRYVYRVKAVNAAGISALSTFLRARTPPSDNNPDNDLSQEP